MNINSIQNIKHNFQAPNQLITVEKSENKVSPLYALDKVKFAFNTYTGNPGNYNFIDQEENMDSYLSQVFNTPELQQQLKASLSFMEKELKNISAGDLAEVVKNNSHKEISKEDLLAVAQVFLITQDAVTKNLERKDDYLKLAEIIRNGSLNVKTGVRLPKGGEVAYDSAANTIMLTSMNIDSLLMRSKIVHELTHAADDLNPLESPLKEDNDGQVFLYESEINSYIAEAEYRRAYNNDLADEKYDITTLQEDADLYLKLKTDAATTGEEALAQLSRLKSEIIRIYSRNLKRAYGDDFDYKSKEKLSDGIK